MLKIAVEHVGCRNEIIFRTREKDKFYLVSMSFDYDTSFKVDYQKHSLKKLIDKYSGTINMKIQNNVFNCDLLLKKEKINSP